MPHTAAAQALPRLARSASFERRDALAQLPDFSAQLLDFLAQLRHDPDRIGECCGPTGVGCQECTLALMADREAIRRQLTDGGAGNGHRDLVALLDLRKRGKLSGLGELAIRDASPQVIGHLLIGEFAGPLDHLHPKSLLGLCLIVPLPQR